MLHILVVKTTETQFFSPKDAGDYNDPSPWLRKIPVLFVQDGIMRLRTMTLTPQLVGELRTSNNIYHCYEIRTLTASEQLALDEQLRGRFGWRRYHHERGLGT